jgi:hypothetical protein
MKPLIISLLAIGALTAHSKQTSAQAKQTFTGTITDGMCSNGDHSHMRMGPTDAECTEACVSEHGASYVLYDGREVYTLSDQRAPGEFAGRKVTVTGQLDAKTKVLHVDRIAPAK